MSYLSRFLILLFVFSLFLSPLVINKSSAEGTASLSISPAGGVLNRGCSFTLEIKVDTGGAQTDGTDAILFYDPTRLAAQEIHNGTIYSDYPGNSIDAQNGKITISGLSSISSAFTGAGTLATVDFTVLDTAPTEGATKITFDFDPTDKAKTVDSNIVERATVTDILNQATGGTYTIGTGDCAAATEPAGQNEGSSASGSGTPRGGQGETNLSSLPTKIPVLPQGGDFNTTVVLAIAGSALTLLGILGLIFL